MRARPLHPSERPLHPSERPLHPVEKDVLERYIARADLDGARIHEDHVPWYLLPGFIGITLGNHIYFRRGAYSSSTAAGLALLGHELTHVKQFREGMIIVGYVVSCFRGYRRSRYEIEARAVEDSIRDALLRRINDSDSMEG